MPDADRFGRVVCEYQDMVFATAVRLLGNRSEAEDVAQTVFLKAFERFGTDGPGPAAPGWLKTVATNLCLNHLSRYRKRWRLFSEMGRDDESGAGVEFEATLVAEPEDVSEADRAGEEERMEAALQNLPDHQRVPLVLYHFEERSYQDIADALGVSLGKVKTDIHRGRLALKTQLS